MPIFGQSPPTKKLKLALKVKRSLKTMYFCITIIYHHPSGIQKGLYKNTELQLCQISNQHKKIYHIKKLVSITKIHQGLIVPITHNYLNKSYFSLFSSFEKALLVTNGVLSWNWVPCPQVNNIYQSWPEAKCRSTQKPEVCQCVWRVCSVSTK